MLSEDSPRSTRVPFTNPRGQTLRAVYALGLGLGMAGLFWAQFSGPFPLDEFCDRRRPTWVLSLFERPRYTAVAGLTFLLVMAGTSLTYLAASRGAGGLRGRGAAVVLLGVVPLVLVAVLVPGYPLLSSDIFKYVFDGRILARYGENPFLHVPAEFPDDRFYDLVYWKAQINAHGPLWRLAEAGSALVGGERCEAAVLAMKAWPTLAYLATTAALFLMLRTRDPERAISGTMLYAWNPLVVLEALQNGHNDVVAALPALLAVWLAARGWIRAAFPLLAVAALVKPLALVLGPLLLVVALGQKGGSPAACNPRREAAWGIGLGAGLIGLAYLPFWAGPATLQGLARGGIFSASPAELVLGLLQGSGLSLERAMPVASALANGLFLLLLGPVLLAAWSGRLPIVPAALGVFVLYCLIAAQWFNPWYLLWAAPLAALAPRQPRVLVIGFTLLAPLVYLLQYQAPPVVLLVFVPVALLAVYWRGWLGWPVSVGGPRTAEEHRWQTAGGG